MNAKALLALAAYLAFAVYGYSWWKSKCKNDCNGCKDTAAVTGGNVAASNLPLSFNWNDTTAVKGEGFAAYRADQVKNLGPSDTLQIKTWYYDGEPNGETVAQQRAEAIRRLYPDLPADRIKIITEKRPAEDKYKNEKFIAQELSILGNKNSLVKKDGDNIIIRFATNSSNKQVEKEIDDYLSQLATDMKANPNQAVLVRGHTDDVGNEDKNLQLSQSRAEFVKGLLVAKGAAADKITAEGKGEMAPIADNKTEEGRRLNRRVELTLYNNQ
jgi:outer membrane protein OmpA-like peptidoglycan-associated protein